MREILFRGKRKDNGKWVYGHFVQVCGEDFIITKDEISWVTSIGQFDISYCDVIPETVGQYTGIKDKNGKKIFEGDIVRAKQIYSIRIKPVIFKNGMFCIVGEWSLHSIGDYKELLVLGNRWDNPELLK